MEAHEFTCPWTGKRIRQGVSYDLDHIIPIAVYPTNEMWNLIPADPYFNEHKKRDRLPSPAKLERANTHFVSAYKNYSFQEDLSRALQEDVNYRFLNVDTKSVYFPNHLANAVTNFVKQIGYSRNIAQF
jgi:hypothetical protein